MLYSICAGQGRTYYLACASRAEADEWANAIRNNVAALPKEASKYFYLHSLSVCGLLFVLVIELRCSASSLCPLPVQCPLPARSAVRTATRR
jgi:hypothetical protein